MEVVAHDALERGEDGIACAMAGIELGVGITLDEPLAQGCQFVCLLIVVEQMETANDRVEGMGTSLKNILQATMSAPCEEQPFCVERQFVTEVIGHIIPFDMLHQEVLVSLGHGMVLRDVGDDVESIGKRLGVLYQQETFMKVIRPSGRDAVQAFPLGEELPVEGIRRDDDLSLVVELQKMAKSSCMVVMPMGKEEHIDRAEVDAQLVCIAEKQTAGSCVEQNPMMLCLQQDGQAMLRLQRSIATPIIC